MIDKSIRQHYQEGDEVKKLKLLEMGEKLTSPLKNKYISQDTGKIKKSEIAKDIGINFAKKAVARKLGLASLNPILGLLSLFGFNPFKTLTEGGAKQAFTSGVAGLGFDSPAEGRELRQLEKRKANMLRRKEEGKTYSKKNLEEVTDKINTIKKATTRPTVEGTAATEDIITRPTIEGTAATEDIITRPTVEGTAAMEDIITRPTVEDTAAMEDIITRPTVIAPMSFNPNEKAAAEKAAVQQAAAVKAEIDRQQREKDIADAAAARARARAYSSPARPHGNGGGNGGGMGKGQDPGGGAAGSPFAKGGRVDKALGGRSRDI
tara:strand:+ start:276 stop:1238 length:963 start_codon:yes stop_codon:yes gene_type:complete